MKNPAAENRPTWNGSIAGGSPASWGAHNPVRGYRIARWPGGRGLFEAIAAAATLPLPWVVNRVRRAIVRFDQACVELLRVFPWQG